MIMPTYLPATDAHSILEMTSKEYCELIFDDFDSYSANKYKANFTGIIKINDPKKYIHKYHNGDQKYPYISFVAKILPV